MTCNLQYDADGKLIAAICEPEPTPPDHKCDFRGPMVELETGMGIVFSATCSVCGRPAFNFHDIW